MVPHLRGTAKLSSSTSPSYALKTLSLNSLDHSALPEAEDNFYAPTSSADSSRIRSWKAQTHSLAGSFGSLASASENDAPVGTPQGSRVRAPDYFSNSPPSPVTLISRWPYTDPTKFGHPAAIEEVTEDEDGAWGRRSRATSADSEVWVGKKSRRGSMMGEIVEEGENKVTEEVCTSCGAEAVASFVALVRRH